VDIDRVDRAGERLRDREGSEFAELLTSPAYADRAKLREWSPVNPPSCCYTVSLCLAKVRGETLFHFWPTITRFMHLTH
jgi:hypothetical protein